MPNQRGASAFQEGRRAAAFLMMGLWLALSFFQPAAAQPGAPEVVVTDVFVDGRADVDAAFLAEGGRELVAAAAQRLPGLLARNAGWRVHPDFLADPARSLGSLGDAGGRVFVRGVVVRADARRTTYFGGRQLWTFSLGLRLEFFDIRSGQIWFGQDVTVRVPVETAQEPDRATRAAQFRDALDAALDAAAQRAGKAYQPGTLEAVCVEVEPDGLLVLDRGTRHGLSSGVAGELAAEGARWLVRVQEAQTGWCRAKVVAADGAGQPPRGASVRFNGVNGLLALDGPPLAVAGVALPGEARLDEWFDCDAATLGQWLHDAMVDSRAFPMLPPLLAGPGAGSELAAAFFRAQNVFSAVGDTRQDEIIGHRSLPQALVRLVVTHADITSSQRLGYEARTLRLGLLLEIYDRRTHEVLLSQVREATRTEKHNDTYRQADLAGAWRELAREALAALAKDAAHAWKPGGRELAVSALSADGALALAGEASSGERGELVRLGAPVKDRAGREAGVRAQVFAMAEVVGGNPASARIVLDDGVTRPQAGDRLRLGGRQPRPDAQVRHVIAGGPKVDPAWTPDSVEIALWAHQALQACGRFNLLAPEALAADVAAAEVALAGGEFVARPVGEILLNDPPRPQVLVDVRVGLGRVDREATAYKAKLSFHTGVEFSFFDGQGAPLALFPDGKGGKTHQVRKAWTTTEEQVLADGRVVQGAPEEEFPALLDSCLRTCLEQLGAQLGGKGDEK